MSNDPTPTDMELELEGASEIELSLEPNEPINLGEIEFDALLAGDHDIELDSGELVELTLELDSNEIIYGDLELDVFGFPFAGPSAYDLAKRHGYTGTEAEWLLSLVGPMSPNAPVAIAAQEAAEVARDRAIQEADRAKAEADKAHCYACSAAESARLAALQQGEIGSGVEIVQGALETIVNAKSDVFGYAEAVYQDRLTVVANTTAAGNYASAARESELAAKVSSIDSLREANSSFEYSQRAEASSDFAGEKALAADTARLEAETSRANALLSEERSALSEQNAISASATAAQHSEQAVIAQNQAGQFASAALTSSQNSNAYADDSLQYADASYTSSIQANSAKAAAEVYRNESASSATNSAGSASQASISAGLATQAANNSGGSAQAAAISASFAETKASEAAISATASNTSKLAAELAATNSSNSASAAVTAASQSQAYRDQSGEFASASSGYATTASTKAGEASTYASQASISASSANTASISSGVSASSAQSVANRLMPDRPSNPSDFFNGNWGGQRPENTVALSDGTNVAVAGQGDVRRFSGSVPLVSRGWKKLEAGRSYRFTATSRVVSPGTDNVMRNGFIVYDANAVIVDYWFDFPVRASNSWVTDTRVVSADALLNVAGAAYIRPCFHGGVNSGGGNSGATWDLSVLRIEDVTESASAASYAATAVTQAASANASAASASISANLAASLSGGALNVNSTFGNYPDNAFAGIPVGWGGWEYNAATWDVARVQGRFSPYAFQQHDNKNGLVNCGISQDYNSIPGMTGVAAGYYVLEADCRLVAGHWHRAGVFVYSPDGDSAYLPFATEADTNGAISADAISGRPSRSWRKLIRLNSVPNGRLIFHLMTQWDGFGGTAQPKILIWDRCAIRPASNAEIAAGTVLPDIQTQLAITASVAADVATRMATARFEVVPAVGANKAKLLIRADTTGSLAELVADTISMSNTVNGTVVQVLKLEAGRALFATPISIIKGARRTTLGPGFGVGNDLHMWSGSSAIAWGSEAIDNGILGISETEGFFGGKTYSGPFDSGTPNATAIDLSVGTVFASIPSKLMQSQGFMSAQVTYDIFISGAGIGENSDFNVTIELAVTNQDGSGTVVIQSAFGAYNRNVWTPISFVVPMATINTTKGDKKIVLRAAAFGAEVRTPRARNGRIRGLYGA